MISFERSRATTSRALPPAASRAGGNPFADDPRPVVHARAAEMAEAMREMLGRGDAIDEASLIAAGFGIDEIIEYADEAHGIARAALVREGRPAGKRARHQ